MCQLICNTQSTDLLAHNNIINQIAGLNKHIYLIHFVPHLSSRQLICLESWKRERGTSPKTNSPKVGKKQHNPRLSTIIQSTHPTQLTPSPTTLITPTLY